MECSGTRSFYLKNNLKIQQKSETNMSHIRLAFILNSAIKAAVDGKYLSCNK